MDYDKLIEQLKKSADFEDYPVVASFAAIIEKKYLREAATALSTLQAENKRLNKIVCSIPTTPDSARTVSQYDKEMSMCAYLDDLEAENEKLRGELEQVKAERDAAIKDIWVPKWISCKNAENCSFVSAITGMPDCAGCDNWEWRGQKKD